MKSLHSFHTIFGEKMSNQDDFKTDMRTKTMITLTTKRKEVKERERELCH